MPYNREIKPGRLVWIEREGKEIPESFKVKKVEDETVYLEDTRDINEALVTIKEERHISEVWPNRLDLIRDGKAHPNDWVVTSNKREYWRAYHQSQS